MHSAPHGLPVPQCITFAGKAGWETGRQFDPPLELISSFSIMMQNRADQKHFKLSVMPCFGLAIVGDTLK